MINYYNAQAEMHKEPNLNYSDSDKLTLMTKSGDWR